MVPVVIKIDSRDPATRQRIEWANSLASHMAELKVTRKDLQHRLAEAGYRVSLQAIGMWLRAETSPRPHMQSAIAHVLQVPARSLFPLERVS